MATPRRMWAALQLLDRQIVDHDGRFAGKVDDVEFELNDNGDLVVLALRSGPGALSYRLGARRLGRWFARVHEAMDEKTGAIPFGQVTSIDNHVAVTLRAAELSGEATERWVRDHIISHIPGNNRAAE